MNVILLGYMASGKSFLGTKLAKMLDYKFMDLDDFIESQEKTTVKDIFKRKGELYFRKIERQALEKILKENEKVVISLGGGTPCYYNNIDLITNKEDINSIYLKVSIPELVNRLKNEKSKRPLIAHIETDELLTEFIGKHLFERSHFYNQADITIDANKPAKEVLESILLNLF